MAVREVHAKDKRELKRFIRMERKLIGGGPLYVGELDSDVRERLTQRSEFSKQWDLALFANERARCAAIVNPEWQRSRHQPETGFIGYFAAGPDALRDAGDVIGAAEERLAARGITRVIAPVNGNVLMGMGALVDAFDESPMFPLAWNPSHYDSCFEDAGYEATYPLWYYEIDFGSERYREFSRRALESPNCDLRPMEKKRWDEEVQTLRLLFNEGFNEEWEFQEFTPQQFKEFYAAFKATFDPRLSVIAEVDGESAGMAVGLPDMSPPFRAAKGRLGPLTILRLMRTARRPSRAGLIGIALRPQFRGRRIGAALASTLYRNIEGMGMTRSMYYLVNESNVRSRGLAESLGGRGRVLYRCYSRELG
jgi:ribosomal protein S18 acetylase RimI-like enzyme